MCSPCGPMVCYKYEDCGPPLCCLPRSAFKRNGLQDCHYFQQGSIRYLCRACPACPRPCPPPCPPCVRRPPPGKTYKGKGSEGAGRAEEGGAEKKDEKENQLKRTKSRELRGGIMYYSCHCIKRNGLQHDCRRTGCGGEPACLVLPDPLCAPSQLTRARGLADPGPLAAHVRAQGGGASGGAADSGSSGGKRFIVCELKGMVSDSSAAGNSGKCCKFPTSFAAPTQGSAGLACCCSSGFKAPTTTVNTYPSKCPCSGKSAAAAAAAEAQNANSIFVLDDETIQTIMNRFETKEKAPSDMVMGPGGRLRKVVKPTNKEPCTRPGCVHWQPPPPCVWDAPCKADCFETHPGVQPGRNPLTSSGPRSSNTPGRGGQSGGVKLLTPECCKC